MRDNDAERGERARVFVGSSSEGVKIGYALQNNLERAADLTVWTQDVFQPSESTLESLMKELHKSDYGLFVFSPDDVVRMRGAEYSSVRDNVIFELGLFMGHVGRENTFILAPSKDKPHLPSDLLGLTVLSYQPDRGDGNLEAALGPASNKLRPIFEKFRPLRRQIPEELELAPLERRGLLTNRQRQILAFIEEETDCSHFDIEKRFPEIPKAELTYRLEQLRLLMFVCAGEVRNAPGRGVIYSLAPSYVSSLSANAKPFRTVY